MADPTTTAPPAQPTVRAADPDQWVDDGFRSNTVRRPAEGPSGQPTRQQQDRKMRDAVLAEINGTGPGGDAQSLLMDDVPLDYHARGAAGDSEPGSAARDTPADTDDDPIDIPDDAAEAKAGDEGDDDPIELEEDERGESTRGTATDAETKKRLDAVRKSEQRQRQAIAQERATLTHEREAFGRERDAFIAARGQLDQKIAAFEVAAARVRADPTGVLLSLGLTVDDLEYAAQHTYAHSKGAEAKPEYRAAARAAQRERELENKIATIEKKATEASERLEQQLSVSEINRRTDEFLGGVVTRGKAAANKVPYTASMIAKNPARAQAELAKTAAEIMAAENLTAFPRAGVVLAAQEKKERARLRELGIEVRASGGASTTNRGSAQAVGPRPSTASRAAPIDPRDEVPDRDRAGTRRLPGRNEILKELAELGG